MSRAKKLLNTSEAKEGKVLAKKVSTYVDGLQTVFSKINKKFPDASDLLNDFEDVISDLEDLIEDIEELDK